MREVIQRDFHRSDKTVSMAKYIIQTYLWLINRYCMNKGLSIGLFNKSITQLIVLLPKREKKIIFSHRPSQTHNLILDWKSECLLYLFKYSFVILIQPLFTLKNKWPQHYLLTVHVASLWNTCMTWHLASFFYASLWQTFPAKADSLSTSMLWPTPC